MSAAPGAAPARQRVAAGQPRPGSAGFAMLVALFVLFLVSMALSLVGLSLEVRLRTAREEARGTTLTTLCDAALAEALAGLALSPQAGGVAAHPFGGGTIGSQVQAIAAQHYQITGTASFEGRSRSVLADVLRDASGTRVVHWQRLR